MNIHIELAGFLCHFRTLRRRHAPTGTDIDLGFGYSRTDTDTTGPAAVPDGVDLYFFTGRTRREATR